LEDFGERICRVGVLPTFEGLKIFDFSRRETENL
jgi:hypothetical protein